MLAAETRFLCGEAEVSGTKFQQFLRAAQTAILDHQNGLSKVKPRFRLTFEHMDIVQCSALKIILQIKQPRDVSVSLWDLMDQTSHLTCADPRDKVFALLGVARSGQEQISPDYSVTLPALLNSVLQRRYAIEPPRNVEEVEQECQKLAAMAGTDMLTVFTMEGRHAKYPDMPKDSDMARYPLGPAASWVNLWWAGFYGHYAVDDLLCCCAEWNTLDAMKQASAEGNIPVVQRLLDAGADDWVQELGLIASVKAGHTELTLYLRDYGTNLSTEVGHTALFEETQRHRSVLAKRLLESGADPDEWNWLRGPRSAV